MLWLACVKHSVMFVCVYTILPGSAGGVCEEETPETDFAGEMTAKQGSSAGLKRLTAKQCQNRKRRVCSFACRRAQLPFDHRKLISSRRYSRAKQKSVGLRTKLVVA